MTILSRVGRLWCRAFHKSIINLYRGQYLCGECQRAYPVRWSR